MQVLGEVPEGSGEDTCWGSRGFCAVPEGSGQIPCEVPEGSGVDTLWGSGSFRCRYLVRFRRVPVKIPAEAPEGSVRFRWVPVQIPCEVPEGSGVDTLWGSGSFRCRYSVRFRRVPVKIPAEAPKGCVRFRRVPVQIPCEVPEGSGVDTLWGSGSFRCRYLVRFRKAPVKIPAEAPEGSVRFRRVPVQIPCEVPEGSGVDNLWGSGSFRCRYSVRFRRVAGILG